jgi:two-component system, response regulator, stage 0 sporulation protein A
MVKRLSIILVEDDPDECNDLVDYIEGLDNISLLGVTNSSAEAINYIKDYLPDVIILDLELQRGSGNGLNVLMGLKQLDLHTKPYVLITTNNSSQITHESARQLGADFIMTKYQADYSPKSVIDFLKIMESSILGRKQTVDNTPSSEPPEMKSKRIVRRIISELNQIGISPKAVGYQYLSDAILLVINECKKNMYNEIGKMHGKTEASVERAMQNAINKAWKTTDIEDLLKYYTARINPEKGVPTITEFVYYYANMLKNEY